MRLEDIGFYTLSDERAENASATTPLTRCELILTGRCNFRCLYCRQVGGMDLPPTQALATVHRWADQGLRNLRLSGGEPTLYRALGDLVRAARERGVRRVAVSTNGSAPMSLYRSLVAAGVNDVSVSLDACCAADGDRMAGGVRGSWERVVANIRELSALTYVTVGVVLTEDNAHRASRIVQLAADLGVADVRVIPAAQAAAALSEFEVGPSVLARYPILRYRVANLLSGDTVRGLRPRDADRCGLVVDDVAAMGGYHFPCVIYLREGGRPIGQIGPGDREARARWAAEHDVKADPICRANCLDVCRDYNRLFQDARAQRVLIAERGSDGFDSLARFAAAQMANTIREEARRKHE